jgi:SAM-dependent methyltransferase
MSDTELLKLNLGCGLIAPEGWENIDKSLSAMLARHAVLRALLKAIRFLPSEVLSRKWSSNIRFYDVRKGLPFRDGSTAYVYVSNLLTALPYQETLKLFQEIYRVLVPGGIIRVVDLDVLKVTREYNQHISQLGSGGEARLAPGQSPVDKLAFRLGFRVPAVQRGFLGRHFGKSRVRRVWLYDAESAKMYAESCGFVCSLKGFRDSRIPDIDAVERNEFIDTFSIEGEKRC